MKRSLYLRLFLTFFVVLFLALSLITSTFVFARQILENEEKIDAMMESARSLARTTYDWRQNTMTLTVYRRFLQEACGTDTAIWVFDPNGLLINVSGLGQEEEQISTDEVKDSLSTILATGKELVIQGGFTTRFGKQVITVAVPIYTGSSPAASDTGNVGAVYIHKQYVPLSIGMLDTLLLWALVIALVLSALPMVFVVRSVTRPLKEMAQAAQRYAEGDFEKRISPSSISEIDMLAAGMNQMAGDLANLDQLRIGFVANVSHELRSPLTSMSGYLQGILDGTIPKEEYERYLKVVFDETRRLTRLVSDLLNLSKMESGSMPINKTRFDVCELMRRVIIRYESRIDEKNLDVNVMFVPEQCFVWADQDRIEQVVSNLVDNAIKFLPEGGVLSLFANGGRDFVYLTVKDNGVGISQEDLPFIFERFYKVDKAHTSGGGTGLGLSIAQKIVEYHGGKLVCRSKEGEGTEFTFKLPVAISDQLSPRPEKPSDAQD